MAHVDLFGTPIKAGDYIVYAAVDGRSGTLRVGQVLELKPNGKVFAKSWSNFRAQGHSWTSDERSGRQKNVTLSFLDRMIVVHDKMIPEKIWLDLEGPAYGWDGKELSAKQSNKTSD